jgi:ectoine hydroxylase-related dioxygenase (phytanoyl-CoA dioxygenase family)
MLAIESVIKEVEHSGFVVIENIFSDDEVEAILDIIRQADTSRPAFRRTTELFAIRRFFVEVPQIIPCIFNNRLRSVFQQVFGNDYFVAKSIYFDKPGSSNWFVSYHQDLTISVNKKIAHKDFGPWSLKQDQYAVQPPLTVLQKNFTIRIHLDDTDENNGGLRVVPGSHAKGIYRPEKIDWSIEKEVACKVNRGGIMIMKPLLLHASNRTTNNKKRRIIHIEFSNSTLPEPLKWSEHISIC